jgi:hypothetical protein
MLFAKNRESRMTRIARIKMGFRDYPRVSPNRIDQQKEIEQEHAEFTEKNLCLLCVLLFNFGAVIETPSVWFLGARKYPTLLRPRTAAFRSTAMDVAQASP